MSVVSEIKKGNKKIKAAQLDRITDISGKYFAEYNSSTGECKNPVAEPITNIVITGNSTKVNADPDIPNDYVAIEYIETTSTQYIDTLVTIDSITNVKYEIDINLTELNERDGFIGTDSHWYNALACHNLYDGFIFANENRPLVRLNYGQLSTGVRYKVIVDKDSLTVNGVSGKENSDTNTSFEGCNILIPNMPSAGRRGLLKYYMCKIFIDGNLTRYFVPVIRKSDNKPGMYDKVSKQFFVNQGTGEFITGPELPGKILETDTLTKHGKNLLNIPDQEYTQNGVKVTVKNGLITLNGTSTGRAWIILNSTVNLNKGFYYFNKHKNNVLLRINENTVRYIEQSDKFTINEDNITIAAQISQEENVIYTNKQYIMSVTKSSTEQIYEPYQQPEAISFDKDAGNMLNIPDQGPTTINGITYTIKDGVITLNGTSTDAVILLLGDVIPTNSTNSFRVFNESKTFTTNSIRFYSFYDVGSNVHNWIDYLGSKDAWTNTNYDVGLSRKFRLHIYAGQTFNNYIVKPMLVEGSVIPNKFYSYGTKIPDPVFGINDIKDKIEVVRDVEYNQLVINGNLAEDKNWYNSNSTHKINNFILESTATSRYGGVAQWFDASKYREHKMLCMLEGMIESNDNGSYFGICLNDNIDQSMLPLPNKANEWQLLYAFGTINKNANGNSSPLVKIQDPRSSNWTKRYARNIRVIDLTQLFGAGNEPTTLEEFYSTPIGKLMQKGVYLPYSETNNRISKVTRYRVANKIDLGTLDYNLVTLDGNPGFIAKTVPLNMQRDDTSINDAGYKYDGSLSKDRTFNTYRGSGGPWFRNDAFTRDQQGCDDLKASLSGKYLLYKLLTPYYEDITDTPQGQALLNLAPYQPYTTEFEVNNDGTIEFGYWRQIDPLPDTYTRVKALVSDGNQFININFGNANNMQYNSLTKMPPLTRIPVEGDKCLWLIKYYKDNAAVFNYIPCIRNNDLKPGFYEVSTGIFHTNQGTGEFMYNNDWSNTYVDLYVSEITYCSETTIIS